MRVLSLAWKYHPSITSGIGVACEGLNNALSKLVELTVIYPKVSKIQVNEEIILSSEDLSAEQRKQIESEYVELIEEGKYELAVRLDPYFSTRPHRTTKKARKYSGEAASENTPHSTIPKEVRINRTREKLLFEEVDVFGERVKDKIYVYNRLVEELARGLEFDVIHAHDWMTFLAGIMLKDRYGKPLVLHIHSLEYDRVGHKDATWVYEVERFAMSKADKVISTSNYTKGIVESNYGLSGNDIETIYNAVTVPDQLNGNNSRSNQVFQVLFVGRIDGNKGIEYFIEIANKVLRKAKNVEFIVVGRGRGDVKFEDIDGFNSVKTNFNYLGFVERETLFNLYKTCDVLCMPSISEPFGLTAIEAAHVGLPVVLSRKTGASEILKRTPQTNFWNTKKFAEYILALKQNPDLRERIIANNRKDVSKLSWQSSALKVYDVFKKLLSTA